MTDFAKRLKALREGAGLTQDELSAKIGINRSQISHWEHGAMQATGVRLVQLADYFKVTTDYLLGRE